jgi:hypothetical protein
MEHIDVTHILNVFSEEINDRSGEILENFRHNERAFSRSLLPNQTEVAGQGNMKRGVKLLSAIVKRFGSKTKDVLQAGVAMKATPTSLELHPYVFRQICSNGCIFGKSIQSRKLRQAGDSFHENVDGKAGETITGTEVEVWFRDAVDACCRPEAFYDSAQKFHTSLHVPLPNKVVIEHALLALLNHEKFPAPKQYLEQIMREYLAQDEPVLFNLINAVTAVARDLHDAEKKWKLESLAGDLAWLQAMPRVMPAASAKASPTDPQVVLA